MLALTRKGKRAFAGEKDFYHRLLEHALTPLGMPAKRLILRALAELPPIDIESAA